MIARKTDFNIRRHARWFLVDFLYMEFTPIEKYLGVGGLRIVGLSWMWRAMISAGWRFGGLIAINKAKVTLKVEIEAYVGPGQ
jgi:hypothetical protein